MSNARMYLDSARREVEVMYGLALATRAKLDAVAHPDPEEVFFMLDQVQSRVGKTRSNFSMYDRTRKSEEVPETDEPTSPDRG